MKIALVTETYPPEVNGVAMTLSRLVGGMRERGHTVQVVRPRQPGEAVATGPTEMLVPGWPIPFYRSLRFGLPSVGRLRRAWGADRPDVVHVATEGPLGWAAYRAATQLGVPVTSSFHTNFHDYGSHYGVRPLQNAVLGYLRWFHNRTRCTMVPTGQMKSQLAGEGFARLEVISRGVDTRLFDPARRDGALRAGWGADEDTPVVVCVGRLAAEKNLSLAVRAFEAMRTVVPGAKFVLVGDGPERAGLSARHPDFHYAGTQRGEALAAHYASADVFLFASVTETFGNVVTEALASGLVVVGYDYAAVREHMVDGVNGWVTPLHDEAAFCARAAEAMHRRAEWSALRKAARATAQGLTWTAIVDRFEATLASARSER